MTVQCPQCQKPVEPQVGAGGKLACPRCGRALSRTAKPLPGTARTPEPSKALATHPDPGASGIAQAISDRPTLGLYVIIGELGRGGMGRVYKAVHKTLRQVRALKVLAKRESSDANVVARFEREARIVAALDHPHIVKVFEFNQDPARGYYYFVMEFVDGGSVGRILKRKGKLPWQQAAEITLQIALGIGEMHRHNLVHRDIKPSNILIDKMGTARLADLGLARHQGDGGDTQLTATGVMMGTIDYMAPEQIVDPRQADIRSDLYALGCTLFHMLAGRVPFPEGSGYQKIQQQIHSPLPEVGPLAPDVPFQLVLILNRLTEKDPNNRYQTPEELIADLETLTGEPAPTDDLAGSTIMQLQALAEAAARDRSSVGIGSSSSNKPTERITERFAKLPAWALAASGVIVGSMILWVIWGILSMFGFRGIGPNPSERSGGVPSSSKPSSAESEQALKS